MGLHAQQSSESSRFLFVMRLLILTGRSGVGKTTAALGLSQRLSCRCVGVGDFLRSHAKMELGTEAPEEAGARLRETVGLSGLFDAFVHWARLALHKDVIVEGVRSGEGVEALRRILQPTSLAVMELVAPVGTRRDRLQAREDLEGRVFDLEAETSGETSLSLCGSCEEVIVIDAGLPIKQVIDTIVEALEALPW